MTANTARLAISQFAISSNKFPVQPLSSETRQIIDNQLSHTRQSNRMLSLFALVLCLALATVLCMLITTSPVNAMQVIQSVPAPKTSGLVALGAMTSVTAAFVVGYVLVRLQFEPARKR